MENLGTITTASVLKSSTKTQTSSGLSGSAARVGSSLESASTPEQRIIQRLTHKDVQPSEESIEEVGQNKRQVALHKEFGILGCVSIIVGLTIGAGIFGKPVQAIQAVDSLGTTLILWLFCGILYTLGGLIYAEIGTTFPVSGGDASYLLIFYGPLGGTLYQFGANLFMAPMFVAIYSAVCAYNILVAMGGEVNESNIDDFQSAAACIAIIITIIAMVICCGSSHLVNILATIHFFCKLVTVFVVIVLALVYLFRHSFTPASSTDLTRVYIKPTRCFDFDKYCLPQKTYNDNHSNYESSWPSKVSVLAQSAVSISFSFGGWTAASHIVEELQEPAKTLPLGVGVSISFITVVYLSVILCYMTVLTRNELKCCSTSVTSVVFHEVAPNYVPWVMPVLVGYSVFGTLMLYLHCIARVSFIGARNRNFPRFFSLVHYKRLTPIPSILLPSLIAILLLTLGFQKIPEFIGAVAYFEKVANALVITGNIYWRIKRPDIKRPFKVPLGVHILVCLLFWFLVIAPFMMTDWTFGKEASCAWKPLLFYCSGIFLVILLIPAYWFFVYRKWTGTRLERALVKAENRIAIFLQKVFLLVEEDFDRESNREVRTKVDSLHQRKQS